MPKYYPNIKFSDCWASAGNVTFYHRDGVCFWRTRPNPTIPGTAPQMENAEIHRRALLAWRNLPSPVQAEWNRYALPVISHRPPFDETGHITGHNLFVSAYHGFAQLGDEHIPEPQPWRDFPVVYAELHSASVEGDDLLMGMRVVLGEGGLPSRYRLRLRLQLTAPGTGRNGGFLRAFSAIGNCSGRDCVVTVRIPDYRTVWKLDLPSYQVHCRYLLIDTVTGYRNTFRRTSFLMNL